MDEKSGEKYWFNHKTGESSWTKPGDCARKLGHVLMDMFQDLRAVLLTNPTRTKHRRIRLPTRMEQIP